MRGARQHVPGVALMAIELGDQREEAVGRGVQVAPELGDLGFKALEGLGSGAVACGRRRGQICVLGLHTSYFNSYV